LNNTSNQQADTGMHFGERIRQLRRQQGLTQRGLAKSIGVSDTYISKVENENLHFGNYPSEKFIHKLAEVLDADEEELLLLADKVPAVIRKRVRERPDAFRTLAGLDDKTLDGLLAQVGLKQGKARKAKRR
jgi:transcriptional regulator with XRE-family HTH domain